MVPFETLLNCLLLLSQRESWGIIQFLLYIQFIATEFINCPTILYLNRISLCDCDFIDIDN